MSYCFNLSCQRPHNPDTAKFCQNCGANLILGHALEAGAASHVYQAKSILGQGGFGRTFLAIDLTERDRQSEDNTLAPGYCVIKQSLPPPLLADPQKAGELFRREADQLAQLGEHPQIPRLLDQIEQENSQYLIQEFIDGDNLEVLLGKQGPFNERQIGKVLGDLLPVLDYIHRHRVIHRDIKPENIIHPINGDRLVLVDFGAAKESASTLPTRTGTIIGSAGYVAPEQAIGKAEFASDLYSLGATCVHLLTGLHPFDLYSVSEATWIWSQYLPEPLSPRFQRVLNKLLHPATNQRYRTAREVMADLNLNEASSGGIRSKNKPGVAIARSPSPIRSSPLAPVWDCVRTLTGHTAAVMTLAISPDGQMLTSGGQDKALKLWNLSTGELIDTFAGRSLWFGAGHTAAVTALTFTPDGQTLFSGSSDGTIKTWDITTKKVIQTFSGHGWGISAIALSQDGLTLVAGEEDGVINGWDLETQEPIPGDMKHSAHISGLIVSPDGHSLISSSYDGTIRRWELGSSRLIGSFPAHGERISAIACSSDGKLLITASWDKTLKFWDLPQRTLLKTRTAKRDRINCLALSPDGQLLASGSEDSRIYLWQLQWDPSQSLVRPEKLTTLRHSWPITSLHFTPDGQTLVSSSIDETIKLWQPRLI